MPPIPNAKVTVGCPPPSSYNYQDEDYRSIEIQIHDFASLPFLEGFYVESPDFSCNGHQWNLRVYPGGDNTSAEGNVSAYLFHRSEGSTTAAFAIHAMHKFGNVAKSKIGSNLFLSGCKRYGWKDYILRSEILDESQHILDDNGILTVIVSIKEDPTTVFVPEHPILNMIIDMFDDKATADVCFEVDNCVEEKERKQQESDSSSVLFHAHRLILKKCAPMLAYLLGDNDKAAITDIKPHVFDDLLYHVYGGEVPREELETHARDFIDAADKYAIINLKLMAEAAYVESTDITFDNAIDNLLYADGKNCALLKEKVVTFLAENHYEAAEKMSFAEFPPNVMKDLLIAVGRMCKNDSSAVNVDELTTLSVSELRRKMHEMGLEVDGSREAMIETLKNSSSS